MVPRRRAGRAPRQYGYPTSSGLFALTVIPLSHAHSKSWLVASKFQLKNLLQLVPTVNGYKRLAGGAAFWAPNAVTWGYDSRAASVRLIAPPSCPPSATRLEVRVPGADVQAQAETQG